MGANSSTRTDPNILSDDDVNFDHFQILRAIGKGSFGKVCIVQKRDTGRLFAMKYVSRGACESRGALGGVLKEVELLATLEHPFLVNLWFSFQDEEDLFMVCDLLTGGDLRYHLQQRVEFGEDSVALLICELGSALDYLQSQRVVHRDIKPDNILLDDDAGYSFPVDWWSLGVVAYEMHAGTRPFIIHSNTPLTEVKTILNSSVHYPRYWSSDFVDLLNKLLNVLPGARLSSQNELKKTPLLRNIDFRTVLKKRIRPPFKPPQDHLNCDPCLELEEMIVETKPLHKKKKRLAKQRSQQRDGGGTVDPESNFIKEFLVYNRYKEMKRRAMERKENEWQKELDLAMANSVVNCLAPIKEKREIIKVINPSNGNSSSSNNDGITIGATGISEGLNSAIDSLCISSKGPIISLGKESTTPPQTTTSAAKKENESIEYIDRTPSPRSSTANNPTS
ncbi:serine/threonine-protein kinase 32A isoform X3 [Condylostylus longicornis]|uniref:serine/threonine-protein kinase 32A isoform X3 n=1 Tax=Condylostylus longicornis TaxID=2530218 RepID=UPI00244DED1D|nr:serine/threonine-protein kinase 32A isoform X3 [Condylostylus longicornis]